MSTWVVSWKSWNISSESLVKNSQCLLLWENFPFKEDLQNVYSIKFPLILNYKSPKFSEQYSQRKRLFCIMALLQGQPRKQNIQSDCLSSASVKPLPDHIYFLNKIGVNILLWNPASLLNMYHYSLFGRLLTLHVQEAPCVHNWTWTQLVKICNSDPEKEPY